MVSISPKTKVMACWSYRMFFYSFAGSVVIPCKKLTLISTPIFIVSISIDNIVLYVLNNKLNNNKTAGNCHFLVFILNFTQELKEAHNSHKLKKAQPFVISKCKSKQRRRLLTLIFVLSFEWIQPLQLNKQFSLLRFLVSFFPCFQRISLRWYERLTSLKNEYRLWPVFFNFHMQFVPLAFHMIWIFWITNVMHGIRKTPLVHFHMLEAYNSLIKQKCVSFTF